MDDQIEPADAERALSEIGLRREQVIRRAIRAAFPGWSWWANAVLMVVLMAAIESGRDVVLWIGIALFVAGSLVINVPVSRAARAARPRRGLDTPGSARRTLIGLATFMAVLIGVLLATAFSLKAAGVPYAATIATAVTGLVFAVGGQLLMRHVTTVLVRQSWSRG
jgi:hypothetical protein